jgi:hypothetical protein
VDIEEMSDEEDCLSDNFPNSQALSGKSANSTVSNHNSSRSKKKAKAKSKSSGKGAKTPATESSDDVDIALLDSFIAGQSNVDEKEANIGDADMTLINLLSCDGKELDVDLIMRRRFGGIATQNADKERALPAEKVKGKYRKLLMPKAKPSVNRRAVFGSPKEDWPKKPPSYVAGGIRMVQVISSADSGSGSDVGEGHPLNSYPAWQQSLYAGRHWFTFQWSAEYRQLQGKFERVQSSGDANLLVHFLSQNPYHLDGLLQLSMIFARTGDISLPLPLPLSYSLSNGAAVYMCIYLYVYAYTSPPFSPSFLPLSSFFLQ